MTLASELYMVQQEIAELEKREALLKSALLSKMQGIKSVKTDTGVMYIKEHRESLVINDYGKAAEWLDANNCWKADLTKARQICRRSIKLPKFFEMIKGEEFLIVKRPK